MATSSLALDTNTNYAISATAHYFNYAEFNDSNRELDKETGFLPGLELSWNRLIREKAYLELNAAMFIGEVNYDGETQAGTPLTTDTVQKIYRLGFNFGLEQQSKLGYYLGVHYYQWDRDIQSTNLASGLFERYSWWEGATGIRLKHAYKDRHWLKIDAGILRIMNPNMIVYLQDFGFGRPKLELGESFGLRLKFTWEYKFNPSLGLGLTGYYEQWDFGRSADKTVAGPVFATIHEPRSETRHSGISLAIRFSY